MTFQFRVYSRVCLILVVCLVMGTPASAGWAGASAEIPAAPEAVYSVQIVVVGPAAIEYRLLLDGRHFATLIQQGGALAFRTHPGCDPNGWGTSWYPQPFLPGATLNYSAVGAVAPIADGIHLGAEGMVARGPASTYGTWQWVLVVHFDPVAQIVTGEGTYTIDLAGPLGDATGDLNLAKIASNYLDDVPLLSGGVGDTGDMPWAVVTRNGSSFTWNPPLLPAHFPTDQSAALAIDVVGQYNNVDTAAMGQPPIAPAFKPSFNLTLTSTRSEIRFGAVYNLAERQCFYCDNVGITPWIAKTTPETDFSFEVELTSTALERCTYLPLARQ